jgi:hypothetical protein
VIAVGHHGAAGIDFAAAIPDAPELSENEGVRNCS